MEDDDASHVAPAIDGLADEIDDQSLTPSSSSILRKLRPFISSSIVGRLESF